MSRRAGLGLVIALAAVVVAAGAWSLSRQGYTPDEEFTLFAVRGIRAHGLPVLPSGLLYDRGLIYSYLSWLAASTTGHELAAARALSLLSAAGALVLGYTILRRISPTAGLVAVALQAGAVSFWAAATTGRFYASFVLASLAVLVAVDRAIRGTTPGPLSWVSIAALAAVARLTHELAFTLIAVPVMGALLGAADRQPTDRVVHWARWLAIGGAIGTGLAIAQATLMALHFVQPPPDAGGSAMIQRFFLWQVLNLFEVPRGAPAGVAMTVMVVSWLVAPTRAARAAAVAVSFATVALVFGVAVGTGATSESVHAVVSQAFAYPLDMFWHLASAHPVLVATGLVLLVARLCGAGGEWPPAERAAHLVWVGWVLWFGVIESGITINYVLLPTVGLLAAVGLDLVAIGQHVAAIRPGRAAQLVRAALVGVALLVVADQWRGTGPLSARLAAARPTIAVAGMDGVRSSLAPSDQVACTDELACLLLVGRVDAWLALDEYVRERFVVMRGGGPVGVYAGAPAAFTLSQLLSARPAGRPPSRVVVVDVFKQYPVGDSRAWLPRALEAEGLEARTLLVTSQARVVELRGFSRSAAARRTVD